MSSRPNTTLLPILVKGEGLILSLRLLASLEERCRTGQDRPQGYRTWENKVRDPRPEEDQPVVKPQCQQQEGDQASERSPEGEDLLPADGEGGGGEVEAGGLAGGGCCLLPQEHQEDGCGQEGSVQQEVGAQPGV